MIKNLAYRKIATLGKEKVNKILQDFAWVPFAPLPGTLKSPGQWLSQFDLAFSEAIEDILQTHHPDTFFVSEEKLPHHWHQNLSWQEGSDLIFLDSDQENQNKLIALLDPIDGTKDFLLGNGECALSFSILTLNSTGAHFHYSWIWNFHHQHEADSCMTFSNTKNASTQLVGLVSRTEWEKNVWNHFLPHHDLTLQPIGSIAYKLLLLATGQCDFVITAYPKNLWDIAAGTHLCQLNDIYLFNQQGEISLLNQWNWRPPLLWCQRKHYPLLKKIFFPLA